MDSARPGRDGLRHPAPTRGRLRGAARWQPLRRARLVGAGRAPGVGRLASRPAVGRGRHQPVGPVPRPLRDDGGVRGGRLPLRDGQRRRARGAPTLGHRSRRRRVGGHAAREGDRALPGRRPLEMLRKGETRCVVPVLHEDRATVREIHSLKLRKYAVARSTASLGLYPSDAPETSVSLRPDPCPS